MRCHWGKSLNLLRFHRCLVFVFVSLEFFRSTEANITSTRIYPDDLFPKPPVCGTKCEATETRIIGGSEAEEGSWPWIAALGYAGRKKTHIHWKCGGALINQRFVLTAAHCQLQHSRKLYIVRLGTIRIVGEDTHTRDYRVERVIDHDLFSRRNDSSHDIALVKLKKNVKFTDWIRPICLPIKVENQVYVNKEAKLAGWGQTVYKGPFSEILRSVNLDIMDNEVCAKVYKAKILPSHICAGSKEGGRDGCLGDSGGPLTIEDEHTYIIGIVSFGSNCGKADKPGVYTRVDSFLPWIKKNMRKMIID